MDTKEIGAALALLKGKAIEQVPAAVEKALEEHPDWTTTVEDGAITKAKLHEDLAEEIEGNTEDVTALKNALQARGIPDEGTTGQVLRKKSGTDYDVEWASVAQPTDEQVETAVDDYLDAHPEQTTTVVDWSLTYKKLAKGTLGFVTPQMFGALADGVTDDAQAIKDAVDYALEHRCNVYIPAGVYIISPSVITINFTGNDSLMIYGDGKQSYIKRKDNSLTSKWDRLFVVDNSNATDNSGSFILRDLYIDSNRRNQENATMDYTYEAAADIMSYFSNTTYYIDTVLFENLWFFDGVADHIDFTGSGVVNAKNIVINNVHASGRVGTRNCIDFPGIPAGNVYISNVSCKRIHSEYNGTPTTPQYFFFNNVICDELTFGGKYQHIQAVNVQVMRCFIIGAETISLFTNCEFNLRSSNNYIINDAGGFYGRFIGCVFNCYDLPQADEDYVLSECTYLKITSGEYVAFDHCKFDYKGEKSGIVVGSPTQTRQIGKNVSADTRHLIFDNCDISDAFKYSFMFYSCGTVVIRNMTIKTQTAGWVKDIYGTTDITFENTHIRGDKTEKFIKFTGNDGFSAGCGTTLRGEIYCDNQSLQMGEDTVANGFSNTNYLLKRIVHITEPLTKSLAQPIMKPDTGSYWHFYVGDEFRYVGENRELYPEKWITNSLGFVANSQFTNKERFIALGYGHGTTANRPTCILSAGWQYYDTDLAKTIIWNGSAWVNCDGTALA